MAAKLNITNTRRLLDEFKFKELFIDELGWTNPTATKVEQVLVGEEVFKRRPLAELSGIAVFEITSADGSVPNRTTQAQVSRVIAKDVALEHVLVFVDEHKTQSVWFWVKREGSKQQPRQHYYFKGQPGDLFISKIASMVVDLAEFDKDGKLPITAAVKKVRDALDVEQVIKKFFKDYDDLRVEFTTLIDGIPDEKDRRWYASVLLNRMMFIYFLQKKFFLDGKNGGLGNNRYLEDKLIDSQKLGPDRYYSEFLQALFFEAFAKPKEKRSAQAIALTGEIKYLNGGLFLPHRLEQTYEIAIPDAAFTSLLKLFGAYSWNLNDIPGEEDNDINPDVLGYIFEKYINQKEFGAYYTRPEITEYLCEQTIHKLILDRINEPAVDGFPQGRMFDSVSEMLMRMDKTAARKLLKDILPDLSILDPAVGSGAFLVAALKTLITVYSAVVGYLQFHDKAWLDGWLKEKNSTYQKVQYAIKKTIITDNLFGVDIMEEATEIAKLRLFMTLVSSAHTVDDLEPLPNIDFNILSGNSLVGLMRVEDDAFDKLNIKQLSLFEPPKTYKQILSERNLKIEQYRHANGLFDDLTFMRDEIQRIETDARPVLGSLLRQKFEYLGVKHEIPTWDAKKKSLGKPKKRTPSDSDISELYPFHWGFEFDLILNVKGGFDAIITNPPWEGLKPQSKEFFLRHSDLFSKKAMTLEQFDEKSSELLQEPDIRTLYLDYLGSFPIQSGYFRSAPEYANQSAIVNGKKTGTDVNLYKLFVERCYHLLRRGGLCGIVIPSGIYSDLGTKGLRDLLINETQLTGVFSFENRKAIFEGVHRSFKFCVLTYVRGGLTKSFPAAFMRHEVSELASFPHQVGITLDVETIRKTAPDTHSLVEYTCVEDASIVAKCLKYPLLGEFAADLPYIRFSSEFHMTNDHSVFVIKSSPATRPLYEGKCIWQFEVGYAPFRYWVDESQGRKTTLGRTEDKGQTLDYQSYRLGFRDIASNTNERTMVSTIIPPAFHGNKIPTVIQFNDEGERIFGLVEQMVLCSIWNSFVFDWMLRQRVTTTLNYFYLYQLPAPRLASTDQRAVAITRRAARLLCVSGEFSDLWNVVDQEVGLDSNHVSPKPGACSWSPACGATDPAERARLRAELDALVAQLYGLTEVEFTHILGTFPLVDQQVKDAALAEFKKLEPVASVENDDELAEALAKIAKGEGSDIEFKSSFAVALEFDRAGWEAKGLSPQIINQKLSEDEKDVVHSTLKTIAAFINSEGGTLFLGVRNDGKVLGLEPDYKRKPKQPDADGLELTIRALLKSRMEPAPHSLVEFTLLRHEGKEFFKISVKPDFDPHHLDGDQVYIRDGNETIQLTGPALTRWIAKRLEQKRSMQ